MHFLHTCKLVYWRLFLLFLRQEFYFREVASLFILFCHDLSELCGFVDLHLHHDRIRRESTDLRVKRLQGLDLPVQPICIAAPVLVYNWDAIVDIDTLSECAFHHLPIKRQDCVEDVLLLTLCFHRVLGLVDI